MDGLVIVYIIFGFFGFVMIVASITMWILWRRRKLSFCNFLSKNGRWERESFKADEIDKNVVYDGVTYKYDIKKCTRDSLNRPIAHYYKGNPEQQIFDFDKTDKSIVINTQEITLKDFTTLMLSKVLRDIFSDDEVMNFLMLILIILGGLLVASIIIQFAYKPPCKLIGNNETLQIIADGVRLGILKK